MANFMKSWWHGTLLFLIFLSFQPSEICTLLLTSTCGSHHFSIATAQKFNSNKNEALLEDEEHILAGLQAYPKQVDALLQPLRYKHKFKHMGKNTGMFTHYEYDVSLGEHVVLMDKHLDIDSLECETTSSAGESSRFKDRDHSPPQEDQSSRTEGKAQPRKIPSQPVVMSKPHADPILEKVHSKAEYSLDIEVTLKESSAESTIFSRFAKSTHLLAKNAIITGAANWGDCKHNTTHRRSKIPLLHRISTTPVVVERDVEERLVTYRFLAEPAELHEMFKELVSTGATCDDLGVGKRLLRIAVDSMLTLAYLVVL